MENGKNWLLFGYKCIWLPLLSIWYVIMNLLMVWVSATRKPETSELHVAENVQGDRRKASEDKTVFYPARLNIGSLKIKKQPKRKGMGKEFVRNISRERNERESRTGKRDLSEGGGDERQKMVLDIMKNEGRSENVLYHGERESSACHFHHTAVTSEPSSPLFILCSHPLFNSLLCFDRKKREKIFHCHVSLPLLL